MSNDIEKGKELLRKQDIEDKRTKKIEVLHGEMLALSRGEGLQYYFEEPGIGSELYTLLQCKPGMSSGQRISNFVTLLKQFTGGNKDFEDILSAYGLLEGFIEKGENLNLTQRRRRYNGFDINSYFPDNDIEEEAKKAVGRLEKSQYKIIKNFCKKVIKKSTADYDIAELIDTLIKAPAKPDLPNFSETAAYMEWRSFWAESTSPESTLMTKTDSIPTSSILIQRVHPPADQRNEYPGPGAPSSLNPLQIWHPNSPTPETMPGWSPNRRTFNSGEHIAHITLNSIVNNPDIGDERNFMGISEKNMNDPWSSNLEVRPNREYFIRMYVHNNSLERLDMRAEGVRARVKLPTVAGYHANFYGCIMTNSATPSFIEDGARMWSDKEFNMVYVPDSACFYNKHFTEGIALSNKLFTDEGVLLGYNALDGCIPGGLRHAGYLSFLVKVEFIKIEPHHWSELTFI